MSSNVLSKTLQSVQVLPVLTVANPDQAVQLCQALYKGGINAVEITLRTAAGLESLATVKKELPEVIVAAGTVNNAEQVAAVKAAGVDFGVSPAATPSLLSAITEAELPFIPGVATPSEAMYAAERGFNHLKLFPATAVGGLKLLKSIAAPLPQLGFCPTGGLNQDNFLDFLNLPNVYCVGGSWMVNSADLDAGNWQAITDAAQRVTDAIVNNR